jgi:hypothetical protein
MGVVCIGWCPKSQDHARVRLPNEALEAEGGLAALAQRSVVFNRSKPGCQFGKRSGGTVLL